jgi:hypothetical protein
MSMVNTWEAVSEVQERPPLTLKISTVGPLGGGDGDAGAPTINAKKRQSWAPWEAVIEI